MAKVDYLKQTRDTDYSSFDSNESGTLHGSYFIVTAKVSLNLIVNITNYYFINPQLII